MKYKIKIFITAFLMLLSAVGYSQECSSNDKHNLSEDLSVRQIELQDILDECPNLTNAINLAKIYNQLDEVEITQEIMLDALNDHVNTDEDRGSWLKTNIDFALNSKNTCLASQYLNELNHLLGFENDYKSYRKKLYLQTKDVVLDSQTIGCALAESRSVSFRGMKIKPKIDLAIHFDFNSDKLTAKGKQQAQQLAEALKSGKLENSLLLLIGHTDSIGSDAYNLDLSQRRSLSVKNYLLTIDAQFKDRVSSKGLGESQLLSQGTTDADHQVNRRVEIQIQ
jgi:outer membrane protein OmpA-like peptidoglycan-associated protein